MVSNTSGKRSITKSIQRAKQRNSTTLKKAGQKTSKKPYKKGQTKRNGAKSTVQSEATADNREELTPRQRLVLERAAAARRKETVTFIISVFF